MGKIVCPQCEKDDRIEKVSGIVATGTTSVKVSGPTGTVFNVGGGLGCWGRLDDPERNTDDRPCEIAGPSA